MKLLWMLDICFMGVKCPRLNSACRILNFSLLESSYYRCEVEVRCGDYPKLRV